MADDVLKIKGGKSGVAQVTAVLHKYINLPPPAVLVNRVKERMLKMNMGSANQLVTMLPALVCALEDKGHSVQLVTLSFTEAQKVMVEWQRQDHERKQDKRKKGSERVPFDTAGAEDSLPLMNAEDRYAGNTGNTGPCDYCINPTVFFVLFIQTQSTHYMLVSSLT